MNFVQVNSLCVNLVRERSRGVRGHGPPEKFEN